MLRIVDTTDADQASAKAFFTALTSIWRLDEVRVLDAFARNGQLTVPFYEDKCFYLHLWELEEAHREALENFSPDNVKIGCSYGHAETETERFGMIVLDTPQGVHQDSTGAAHYEHFDFLKFVPKLLANEGLVVLYVNKAPYDKTKVGDFGYDQYDGYNYEFWMEARQEFYGRSRVTEGEALAAYDAAFQEMGYWVVRSLVVPCHSDVPDKDPYAFRVAFELRKR
jgi:hypothetical protein